MNSESGANVSLKGERDRTIEPAFGVDEEPVVCPLCSSPRVYAPYPPDRESAFGWVTLRCHDCKTQEPHITRAHPTEWRQDLTKIAEDRRILLLKCDDGRARYLDSGKKVPERVRLKR